MSSRSPSRRKALKTGLTTLTAIAVPTYESFALPKIPGETRVMVIGGDYWHNPIPIENHWREVTHSTDWRVLFAQSSQFITPGILRTLDLFILVRGTDPDDFGWSPDGIIEHRPNPAPFMTEVQENAIVENVNRGMGLLCMHGSTRFPKNEKILELIGVKESVRHGAVQNTRCHSINQDHPITKGMKDFSVGLDQTVNPPVMEDVCTLLFKATGERDKTDDNAAWCLERGKGRIVALLPGHLPGPRTQAQYKQIMLRAAHWAMKRDIPEITFRNGTPFRFR